MFRKISKSLGTVKVSICDRLHVGSIYPETRMPANKRKKQEGVFATIAQKLGILCKRSMLNTLD
jgi:hypothetical protein